MISFTPDKTRDFKSLLSFELSYKIRLFRIGQGERFTAGISVDIEVNLDEF